MPVEIVKEGVALVAPTPAIMTQSMVRSTIMARDWVSVPISISQNELLVPEVGDCHMACHEFLGGVAVRTPPPADVEGDPTITSRFAKMLEPGAGYHTNSGGVKIDGYSPEPLMKSTHIILIRRSRPDTNKHLAAVVVVAYASGDAM
jgi:hypothetical protein